MSVSVMRNYIPRSPLTLLLAASFVVFIVFILLERFAIARTVRADLRVCPGSGLHAGAEADTQVCPYSDLQTVLERKAVTSIGTAKIARQQAIPCVFDNFVWFKDQEIVDEIRKDLPSFDGSAPEAGDSIDKILGALKRMLKKKRLPSEVEYSFSSGDEYQYRPEHIFVARDAKIPLCKIVFQNSPPRLEKELQQAALAVVNKDYSRVGARNFVEGAAVQVYRKYGYLRGANRILSAELDQSCKNNIVVKVAAEPGIVYFWDKAVWTGARAISVQSLDAAIELKSGDVADGLKIDTGLQAAIIVYRKLGYIESQVVPKPVFDDVKRRIMLNVTITEGPQFRMGNFIVRGVPEKDVARLTERWALKTGAIYDASYLDEFIKKLVGAKLILPDLAPLLKPEFKLDRERLVIDVIIDFKVSPS